jgi:hypothetical protein
MKPALGEVDARAGDKVFDRARHEHFAWVGGGGDARSDADGDSRHLSILEFALAGVDAGPQVEVELTVRGDWQPIFKPLPPLDDLARDELQRLLAEHIATFDRVSRGDTAGLSPAELETELRIGQAEMIRLRSWLNGEGRFQQERERKWLSRRLRDLAVAAGLGKPVGADGLEWFTDEERKEIEMARLRRNRPPDPRTTSVVAAVVSWLVGTGWTDWVAGSPEAAPGLEVRDVGVLVIALRLIGGADGAEVCWEQSAGLQAGRRIYLDSAQKVLGHLATNELLTHRVASGESWIGYGPLTLKIARDAGVPVPVPTAAA